MKKINWVFNIALVLSGLSLVACGGGGGGTVVSAPAVSSITPAEGSTGVLINATLSVTFNQDMDAATITNSSFSLSGATPVSGSISYNAATRTATFTPDAALKPGTNYTASLTTSITDTTGQSLSTVFQGQFTTETFIRRVSVDSSDTEANESSFTPKVSADGRYVVFNSYASNLVSGDINSKSDIFLRDTKTGMTTLVSVSSAGVQGDADSSEPAISADGRYVVFASAATTLLAAGADTNGQKDIFVHDTQNSTTDRVSISSSDAQADSYSSKPGISADGRYIVFTSSATNLAPVDTNLRQDVFVRDTQLGTTFLVSVDSNEVQATGSSGLDSAISGNGRYVVFQSTASNLVTNDTNGSIQDIFVRDIVLGNTIRVNESTSGAQATAASFAPGISADGRYVAFASMATNLVSNDNNNRTDIFVHDIQNSTTTRVSVSNSGSEAGDSSAKPRISADGRYVAFLSSATNLLVTADSNNWPDVFVRDTQSNTTIRVNVTNNGAASMASGFPLTNIDISANGRYVVFNINANNLAAGGDSNDADDVFRALNTTP